MTSGWLEATCLGLYSLILEPYGSLGAGRLGAVRAGVKLKALAISISFHKNHPEASGIAYPAHSVPSMVRMVGFGSFSPPC